MNGSLAHVMTRGFNHSECERGFKSRTRSHFITFIIRSGKAHLREALLMHEEALRVNRMCRELRKKDMLQEVLRLTHDRSLNKYADIDEEDDFQVNLNSLWNVKQFLTFYVLEVNYLPHFHVYVLEVNY